MPAELQQTRRRFLSIQGGRMKERVDETTLEHNCLSSVHLVNVTFRDVEKEENGIKKKIGHSIQLHLLDETDYFILETWSDGSYARCFYQVMQNLDLSRRFTLITDERTIAGKKKPVLFVKQDGFNLKWCYTMGNMQDCPPLTETLDHRGKSTFDNTLQNMFFFNLVETWLIPSVLKLPNPYPEHPVYENKPTEEAKTKLLDPIDDFSDDLPF